MSKKKAIELSIVIPALNEEKRVGKSLDELAAFLKKDPTLRKLAVEVVVVSANSRDKTHEIIASKAKKFPIFMFLKPGARVGKGRDVAYAMLRANGKYIVFMDADLATPLRHLPQFYKMAIKDSLPIVVGTRNLQKHHHNIIRRTISNGGNLLFRIAGGVWIEDSQCGFKMFERSAAQLCFSKLTIQGWGFDMEVLAIARANKLRIKTVRLNDWKHMPDGTFEEGMLKNIVASLGDLMHIARHRLTGTYKR